MDLREVSTTNVSPYRCYVRGNVLQTEGDNVKTIGFKDGIAVLQATDMLKFPDNILDSNAIDLTKLKKITVKVDPKTGKKYIHKDGKRIEILPQFTSPNLKPTEATIFKKDDPVLPKLVPTGALFGANKMRILDNVKYHVVSMNVKKPSGGLKAVSTMTECELVACDKTMQTDSVDRREVCTQTEPLYSDGRGSPESFFNFILGTDSYDSVIPTKMIDPGKLTSKEEIYKFNFFNDMRNAVKFDLSGNLPIHDSVMQNNLKAVQKNCVVLRAVKKSVNILNQSSFAPLHLAVLHNVSIEILKVLLHNGAELANSDPEGNTAIHLAIEHGRSHMLKVLINHAKETNFHLDVFNYEGFTPLILACLNRAYQDAKLLLENNANPNVKDMKSGRTALFHAAEAHDVNLVELLIQHHADTKIRNFFGTSPHDAMFELDDMPLKIKFSILGRDPQRFQNKKKVETKKNDPPIKRAKLEITPVLRKVTTSEMIGRRRY